MQKKATETRFVVVFIQKKNLFKSFNNYYLEVLKFNK